MGAEVKDPRGQEAADYQNEGTGDAWRDHPQPEDDNERDDADHQRRPANAAQGREPGPQFLNRIGARDIRPSEFWKLADHHVNGRSEEEACDNGAGQELGDPPHFEHGQEKEEHARCKGDCGDKGRYVLGSGNLRSQDRTGRHSRKPRTRSGRDLAARPEDGVENRASCGGVEAVLYRDPGDGGIAQVLWDDERSNRHTGDEIASQPTTIVGTNPSKLWARVAIGPLGRHHCRFEPSTRTLHSETSQAAGVSQSVWAGLCGVVTDWRMGGVKPSVAIAGWPGPE